MDLLIFWTAVAVCNQSESSERMQKNIDPLLNQISTKEYGDKITDEEARTIEGVFRELYSSVLRFTRGGGEIRNLFDCIRSASVVVDRLSNCSQQQVEEHLRKASDWKHDDRESPLFHENRAIDQICSGALQSVASRLIGPRQGGQISNARDEIHDGIKSYLESQKAEPE